MVVFGQNGCIRVEWFYSVERSCILEKMVVFGQSGCIRVKLVVFGQSDCIRSKVVLIGQKWLYSGKSGCIHEK